MPYYCSVPRCTSRAGITKNVSFHRFPRDEGLASLWNKILKRRKPYTKYSKVCSLHFLSPGDFYDLPTTSDEKHQRKTLRCNAIPSQNLPLEPPGLWVPNHATTMPDTQVLSPVISSVPSLSQPAEQGKQNMVPMPTLIITPIEIRTEILETDSIDIKLAISSVSSISQPAEQGKQNMVPTVTTAPIDIKTEILETDSIDMKLAISSVSSLSQPAEQGKQNMVPTLTTAPIEIDTEILETDYIDIKPAISSVSSLSQPAEQGKQNMVPTLTTAPIEIKTEILGTDSIDIKPAISSVSSLSQSAEQGKQNMVPTLTTAPIDIKTEIMETDSIDVKLAISSVSSLSQPAEQGKPNMVPTLTTAPIEIDTEILETDYIDIKPVISSVSSLSQPAEQGKQNMVPTLTTAPIDIKTEILETDSIDVKLAISSVSSLSQPAEQGKPNMVPTLTTAPIEIDTEILETDYIDIKQEPLGGEPLSIDLDTILGSMYVQKPQLDLPAYDLTPHTNRALSHQPLSNKPPNIPVNPDPNRIIVPSEPSQKAPKGRATKANVVVLSRRMVFELRDRERTYLNNLKTKFLCDKCVMSYKNESAYIAHLEKHLPEAGPTVCDICELRFKKMDHLNLHYKAHFRAYSCGKCRGMSFVCRTWSAMERHLDAHERMSTYDQCGVGFKATDEIVCPQCKLKFLSQASFDEHVRFAHQSVKCKKCNLVAEGLRGLKTHYMQNKVCGTYGEIIVKDKDGTSTTKSYCGKCDKFFKTRLCFVRHLITKAHYTRWFECDYCGKKYSTKSILSTHIEFSHMKTGNHFACDKCGEAFQSKEMLNKHLKNKLEAKIEHCCDVCGKTLTTKRMLSNHQRIHSDIRAYQCGLCPWNFTQKRNLRTHMKHQHKEIGANSAAPAAAASAANVRKRSAANTKKRKARKKKK